MNPVPFQRVDGEVRVTDRATGTSVRAVCRAVLGEPGEDSLISVELRTNLAGDPVSHRMVDFLHHGVEADSIRELRCVLRAFDAILDHLPKDNAHPEDLEVCVKGWNGPEPCDAFGEVATDGDEGASWG